MGKISQSGILWRGLKCGGRDSVILLTGRRHIHFDVLLGIFAFEDRNRFTRFFRPMAEIGVFYQNKPGGLILRCHASSANVVRGKIEFKKITASLVKEQSFSKKPVHPENKRPPILSRTTLQEYPPNLRAIPGESLSLPRNIETGDLNPYLQTFNQRAQLATSGKGPRLQALFPRYIQALGFNYLVYPIRRRGWQTSTRTFMGDRMEVMLPAATDLYLLGIKSHDSEVRLTRFLLHFLQPGDHVADVGAHFGYFSLVAARCVGESGQVHSFEAASGACRILRRNTKALPWIAAHHLAVSSTPGEVSFTEFPVHYSEFNTLHPEVFESESWFQHATPRRVTVQATPLDAWFASRKVPRLIKIDVEGAEAEVIQGMKTLLATHRPVVTLECWGPARPGGSHREAQALLLAAGYTAFSIGSDGQLLPCPDTEGYLSQLPEESDNLVFRHPTGSV